MTRAYTTARFTVRIQAHTVFPETAPRPPGGPSRACISMMRSRISGSMRGRPGHRDRLSQRQYRRKPCRCQRTTVSRRTRRSP